MKRILNKKISVEYENRDYFSINGDEFNNYILDKK